MVGLFDLGDFVQAALVASARVLGAEKFLDDDQRLILADHSAAQGQHIGVVVLPGAPGRQQIMRQGRANAAHLVRGDGDADAGPAHQDSHWFRSRRHPLGNRARKVRIVDRILRPGARIVDGVARVFQELLDDLLYAEAGVIGAQSDSWFDGGSGHVISDAILAESRGDFQFWARSRVTTRLFGKSGPSMIAATAVPRSVAVRLFKPQNAFFLLALTLIAGQGSALAQALSPQQQLARDIYRELVEINTVTATGDTLAAAQAMAARLRAAGFAAADVQVLSPAPRKGNLVARLRGTGARRPIMLMAHIDVVPAKREDWSMGPFQLLEKDGYFYGRGTGDNKFMAAAFVSNLIRYKQEGFVPNRDMILVLETDEEILDANAMGIQWLLKNHRNLIDAEFALNEGGTVDARQGKPLHNDVQTSEKVPVNYSLEVTNPGGHSSLPTQDNAIYRLAEGLARLSRYQFPLTLNETTRAWLERAGAFEDVQVGADMGSVASGRPDPSAVARLSAVPAYNAQLRTTCVATMLQAGHAFNALPQTAQATVNCRVLPGESVEEVQKTLVKVLADDQISVAPTWTHVQSPPSPLNPEILRVVEQVTSAMWPGVPVIPRMGSGATDGSFLRNVGIPTYGTSGRISDIDDFRSHGRDERIRVKAFYDGHEYLYRLVKALSSGK